MEHERISVCRNLPTGGTHVALYSVRRNTKMVGFVERDPVKSLASVTRGEALARGRVHTKCCRLLPLGCEGVSGNELCPIFCCENSLAVVGIAFELLNVFYKLCLE